MQGCLLQHSLTCSAPLNVAWSRNSEFLPTSWPCSSDNRTRSSWHLMESHTTSAAGPCTAPMAGNSSSTDSCQQELAALRACSRRQPATPEIRSRRQQAMITSVSAVLGEHGSQARLLLTQPAAGKQLQQPHGTWPGCLRCRCHSMAVD